MYLTEGNVSIGIIMLPFAGETMMVIRQSTPTDDGGGDEDGDQTVHTH